MYVKHVFFHHLIISLLDHIQGPDHGIIVPLVAKCSLHVHQQVPHRDVFAFVQCADPFTRVPMKMWGHILASSYCSRKASTLKCQSVYVTSAPGLVNLKIGISSLTGASHFLSLLPLQTLHLHQRPAVSLSVEYLLESGAPLSGRQGANPLHQP